MIDIQNLTKIYSHRKTPVHALDNISINIEPASFIAITGVSGSGKSTLLLSLGGLIRPSSGKILFNGKSIYDMSAGELAHYRNLKIGFVLQTFNLIPYLTAIENVMLPTILQNGNLKNGNKDRAAYLLGNLGLTNRLDFLPRELSVGQQQRVAIARALANDPDVILADEPTGNLDPGLSEEILDILKEINQNNKKTVIMVTHNPDAARKAQKVIKMEEGKSYDL